MTKRYTGGVVSSSLPTVNAAGASGVFNLSQQADAQSKNNWPPFKVEKSLRFRRAGSTSLKKTFAIAGNKTKWTYSTWIKITDFSNTLYLLGGESGSNNDEYTYIWTSSNKIGLVVGQIGTNPHITTSAAVFRDPSAWYHVVSVFDSSQSTDTNRWRLYVNGVEQTMSGTIMSQNYSSAWINGANRHD